MSNFDIDVSIVHQWLELVMLHDIRWDDANWDPHVSIVPWLHGCAQINSLEVPIMQRALGMEMTLLNKSLAVTKSAVLVLTLPSQST